MLILVVYRNLLPWGWPALAQLIVLIDKAGRVLARSTLLRKLFDSHTNDVIDDHNYEMLMTGISEKAELSQKLAEIDFKLSGNTDDP